MTTLVPAAPVVVYPDSDGQPMAENTLQAQWIMTLCGNLSILFAADPAVFVAMDNLWYPVEGRNDIRVAPDVYVAFGRPKGHRGSYRQWEEANVPLTVTFEVLSPGNRAGEMAEKFLFYDRYGVEEYYILDPDREFWQGFVRGAHGLAAVRRMEGHVSPRLGVTFAEAGGAAVFYPDGRRFQTFVELGAQADADRLAAASEWERADKLAAKLRALGVDPDAP